MTDRSLDVQLEEFRSGRLIAMPIAGTIMWAIVGVCGIFAPKQYLPWILFAATGTIVYLGLFISRFTGENMMNKDKPKNRFDTLFFMAIAQSLAVFAIAVPFFMIYPPSLPMSLGILTGLMWMQVSWLIGHWVGVFHTVSRTILCVILWLMFPEDTYVMIPAAIVLIYGISIYALNQRWKRYHAV